MTAAKSKRCHGQAQAAGGSVAMLLFIHGVIPAHRDSFIISQAQHQLCLYVCRSVEFVQRKTQFETIYPTYVRQI